MKTTEQIQWGVRGGPGNQHDQIVTHCTDPGGVVRAYDESLARYDASSDSGRLYRRTVTTVIGDWEEVQ